MPILAPSLAMRRSQVTASSHPAPKAAPFTKATVGQGTASTASMARSVARSGRSPPGPSPSMAAMSKPEEKAWSPAPRRTRQRTLSVATRAQASVRAASER